MKEYSVCLLSQLLYQILTQQKKLNFILIVTYITDMKFDLCIETLLSCHNAYRLRDIGLVPCYHMTKDVNSLSEAATT